jgi:hypothetical protein
VDIKLSGADDGPLQLKLTTDAPEQETPSDSRVADWAKWLTGGFALLTGVLAIVGTYTGGIGRILRNDPWLFIASVFGVIIAVILGLWAGELTKKPDQQHAGGDGRKGTDAEQPRPGGRRSWQALGAGIIIFLVSILVAMYIAAVSASTPDRPTLSAHLVASGERGWSVKGTAAATGLKTDGQLQLLVYAIPQQDQTPLPLIYTVTGPNSDGVASTSFEAPLPEGEWTQIIVTANSGIYPRTCMGQAIYKSPRDRRLTDTMSPEERTRLDRRLGQAACITLAPPAVNPTA